METKDIKKIACACFIGGAVCSAIALLMAPTIWWLGMIAGFAGGYMSYEFKEFRKEAPAAFKEVGGKGKEIILHLLAFFKKPHPYAYYSICIWTTTLIFLVKKHREFVIEPRSGELPEITLLFFCMIIMPVIIIYGLLKMMSIVGKGNYLGDFKDNNSWSNDTELETYGNVLWWILRGVGRSFFLFFYYLSCFIVDFAQALKFLLSFGWKLFKRVHSERRLLCGLDGSLGGAISYLYFSASENSAIVILFGGLLGSACGIIHHEISKRVLGIEIQPSS